MTTLSGDSFILADEHREIVARLVREIERLEAELEEARAEIKDLEAA